MLNNEKIVYFLGAGFSAPAGLPVMSNFLEKAKDIYFENPSKYKYFIQIFETIKDLSVVKNYFTADLFNIEEILSLIEMQSAVEGKKFKKAFLDFIKDVITSYTPNSELTRYSWPSNWYDIIFSELNQNNKYGHFIGNIFGYSLQKYKKTNLLTIMQSNNIKYQYDIVSLNYDTLLESFHYTIKNSSLYHLSEGIEFVRPPSSKVDFKNQVSLAKLHGSVDNNIIIPPTWNKTMRQKIKPEWQLAYNLLKEANHIRIIGYSLPETDSYVKYLLRVASINAEHLKSIDVICLDNDGSVKKRYDSFIDFSNYRFFNTKVESYLEEIATVTKNQLKTKATHEAPIPLRYLESAHNNFCKKYN